MARKIILGQVDKNVVQSPPDSINAVRVLNSIIGPKMTPKTIVTTGKPLSSIIKPNTPRKIAAKTGKTVP